MRDTMKALVITSVLVLAIVVTGCVQNSDNSVNSTNVTPGTPVGSTGTPGPGQPANEGMQNSGTTPSGPSDQTLRQHALPNTTVLTQAAEKLGVSEQELENALMSQAGVRQNLTIAAKQLNVSPQQLAEALGIPSGFQGQRGNHNATRPAGS